MNTTNFKTELEVRDYECDIEGIVNNAVYLNYLEHARHGFIRGKGYNFSELIRNRIHLVVIRIEADYLFSLRSGDRFEVTAILERESKLRFNFLQEIIRIPDGKPIMKATVFATALNEEGRPKFFKELEGLFA